MLNKMPSPPGKETKQPQRILRRFYLKSSCLLCILWGFLLLLRASAPHAAEPLPMELEKAGITEHLGRKIPLDLTFINESGQAVPLANYFNKKKPVIINLVYYECPMLCNLVLNGLTDGLKQMEWTPGKEFDILTITINPDESYQLAQAKKEAYLESLGRPAAAEGWHWFASDEKNVKALADALGFNYYYDKERKEYAHSAGIFILTPGGVISRYLYGITFAPKDLKFALLEASEGHIGSTLDKLVLFCYHYDPQARGYTLMAMRLMQLGGGATVLLLGSLLGSYFLLERRRQRRDATKENETAPPVPLNQSS